LRPGGSFRSTRSTARHRLRCRSRSRPCVANGAGTACAGGSEGLAIGIVTVSAGVPRRACRTFSRWGRFSLSSFERVPPISTHHPDLTIMSRPVTLFTGQWADLPSEELFPKVKAMGFDGVELACWGDHFDVQAALNDPAYIPARWELLKKHGLACYAISAH